MDWKPVILWAAIFFVFFVCVAVAYITGFLYGIGHLPKDELHIMPYLGLWPPKTDYSPPAGASGEVPPTVNLAVRAFGGRTGRPTGSLSAASLPPGTRVEDIKPFIRLAKKALDANDGSFQRLCDENGHKERTVRDWIRKYGDD